MTQLLSDLCSLISHLASSPPGRMLLWDLQQRLVALLCGACSRKCSVGM